MLERGGFVYRQGEGALDNTGEKEVKIVVDAMGGDHAPEEPVKGAVLAARATGIPVILVGNEKTITENLAQYKLESRNIEIVHAPDVVGMHDHPVSSVKSRPGSSIRVAFDLLVSGKADALFSAGNTGAVMASSVMFSGRINCIDRPAVATILPSIEKPFLFLDAGANTACRARHLVQFALMGAVYAREVLGIEKPRVGLLSNGVEESKGTGIQKRAREKIKLLEGIEYMGFVEGDEMMKGHVDVLVTDGFTGNLVLKTIEGVGEFMVDGIEELFQGGALSKLGITLLRARITTLHNRIDYAQYGGAPLVGVRHTCIVGHGRSSAVAISNAIKLAAELATADYPSKLAEEVSRQPVLDRKTEDIPS